MEASGIKVKVQVDTDDLDIAIGKAKELNKELKKAKAMMNELTRNDVDTTIVVRLEDEEVNEKENFADVIKCVMESLRRDIKSNY